MHIHVSEGELGSMHITCTLFTAMHACEEDIDVLALSNII